MIDLILLKQLIYIEKYGTISKAAKHLHLSQSTLSRSMQKLESNLQVTLFTRQKNKVILNETGILTVSLGKKLLEGMDDIVNQIQKFDYSQRTLSIGSCAPAPLWKIEPILSRIDSSLKFSCEMEEPDILLQKLNNDDYQIIIIPYKISNKDLICFKYEEEHLYFSLPLSHPLVSKNILYFKDLDGETMLLRSKLGYWHNIHHKTMPHTRFLVQDEQFAFDELVKFSELPSFSSDLAVKHVSNPHNRIIIPIADQEANVTYYCLYKKKNHQMLGKIINLISKKVDS